jgi:signal transduction histidine kinase
MLSNLLGNAIEYGAGGVPIAVRARGDGDKVLLEVQNAGTPIPEIQRARMFEPLARNGPEPGRSHARNHLGLGLYISRLIAEAHGGAIRVESDVSSGTTFSVSLPRRTLVQGVRRDTRALS